MKTRLVGKSDWLGIYMTNLHNNECREQQVREQIKIDEALAVLRSEAVTVWKITIKQWDEEAK